VELIEIINKLLLVPLVSCLYYYINDALSDKHQIYKDNVTAFDEVVGVNQVVNNKRKAFE